MCVLQVHIRVHVHSISSENYCNGLLVCADHLLDPVSSQQLVPDSRQVRVAANDRDQPLHAAGERGEVQDRRNQTTDISRIVKSEMKKFLQVCICMLDCMLQSLSNIVCVHIMYDVQCTCI